MKIKFNLLPIHCILLASTLTSSLVAHDEDHDHPHVKAVAKADMYRPTAMPDRIVLTLSGDATSTQSVTWRTSTEVSQAIAEIAVAAPGPQFPKSATTHKATTQSLKTDINKANFHSCTFTDLKPATRYAYRVGDGTNWSEWFQFSTAAATPEPFSFVYFGDAQNNVRSMWSRVVREAYRDAPKAAFMLHAGDLVNRANSDAEWGEWFGAGAWINAMIPSIAIPGNHEQVRRIGLLGIKRSLTDHWRPTFTFPENGPKGLEETCYTLTYHNMRFIGLNSNTMQEEQAHWLDQVLAANKSEWVVCSFHHPIFSTGRGRDNPEIRALWKPILDKYKVDLVLQGHDHTYGRTGFEVPANGALAPEGITSASTEVNVTTGAQAVDTETGTVYVVSVSGPKMYNNTRFPFMKRLAEDTQLYQIVHVDGDELRFEARTAIGQLYDAFELHKQGQGKINELIELQPEMDEILRPESEETSD